MGVVTQGMGTARPMTFLLIVLLFLLFCTPHLWSQDSHEDFERGLNLNYEQRIRVEQIRKKYMEELLSNREETLQRRLELLNELKKKNPDPERVSRMRREIEELRMKRFHLFERYRDEIRGVLSAEQKRLFDDFCRRERRRMKKSFD